MADKPLRVTFKAGEEILHEGVYGQNLYIIEEGEVEVFDTDEDNKKLPLAIVKKGEFLGEMAIFTKSTVSADAIALSDVSAICLTKEMVEAQVLLEQTLSKDGARQWYDCLDKHYLEGGDSSIKNPKGFLTWESERSEGVTKEKLKRVIEVKWWSGGVGVGAVAVTYENGWRAYIGTSHGIFPHDKTEDESTLYLMEYGSLLSQKEAEAIFPNIRENVVFPKSIHENPDRLGLGKYITRVP